MYTPHPSLVPIEMCAAGMSTVTNTFENKDAPALHRISSNMIAAPPTVDGVAAALAEAEARSVSLDDRAAGSRIVADELGRGARSGRARGRRTAARDPGLSRAGRSPKGSELRGASRDRRPAEG